MNRRAITLLAAGHFLTDLCQGTVPALLPFLVIERQFSYTAAASLVFAISASSSVVQPLFGQVADRLALAWLLPASILLTGAGLALGAQATTFALVLLAFALSGLGVAAFHPEAARQAYHASGDRRATGMSWFTVGGVVGFALAPMLTTALVVGWGIKGVLVLLLPTGLVAILLAQLTGGTARSAASHQPGQPTNTVRDNWRGFVTLSGATICRSIVFFGLNTFLALYFMSRWGQSAALGNRALAVFLTLFVLTSNQTMALALLVPLALCIFLPSSVQVVLGQEYLPSRVGMASGVTLGLAVSVGGMAAPLLGRLADWQGLSVVFLALLVVVLLAMILTFALPPTVGRVGVLRSTAMSR
jgi:FSR family fosmidomycin resistance protein-like MFS transporter